MWHLSQIQFMLIMPIRAFLCHREPRHRSLFVFTGELQGPDIFGKGAPAPEPPKANPPKEAPASKPATNSTAAAPQVGLRAVCRFM